MAAHRIRVHVQLWGARLVGKGRIAALTLAAGFSMYLVVGSVAAQAIVPARDPRASDATVGTAIVRGRVLSTGSDSAPIRGARVSIAAAAPGVIEPVFTDVSGRFEFTGLPAGRYTLTAEKPGFARTHYGATNDLNPPGPVDVVDAAVVDGLEIGMLTGAAILGRVLDDLGEPVVGALVSVGVLRAEGAMTHLISVSRPGLQTDDRGEYRAGDLPPGRYYVSVNGASEGSPIGGAPAEWARTVAWSRTLYFDSPSLAGATPIALGTGEQRAGVDFALVPTRPAKLTVSLTDATGAPATGLVNLLLPGDTPGSLLANRGVPLSPANPQMTPSLEPGDWVAVALGRARAIAHVTLASGDEASLPLTLGSGARLSGRVVFEGSSAPPAPSGVRLGVRGAGPDATVPAPGLSSGPVFVQADGTFEINGVIGTIVLETASPVRGWALRAVRSGDRDLLDEPLTLHGGEAISDVQVIFTDQLPEFSGRSVDRDGRPSPGCTVAIFPSDERARLTGRRARLVRSDQNGRFSVSGLPSGSYLAAAMADIDAADWLTTDSLSRLRIVATAVSLADRETTTIDLACTSGR